ncbi:MAG: hypothetical protein FJ109_03840 [Deltaproteobacteria bacterium]|nr:hypothetical protein [Deltaproteobacteria bacterium]
MTDDKDDKKDDKPDAEAPPDGPAKPSPWGPTVRITQSGGRTYILPPEGQSPPPRDSWTAMDWEEMVPSLTENAVLAVTVAYGLRVRKQLGLPADEDPQEAARLLGVPWETVLELLPPFSEWAKTAFRKPGRPRGSVAEKPIHPGYAAVLDAVRDFVIDHPGAVAPRSGGRRYWSPEFKACVLQLIGPSGPGAGMTLDEASRATGVPISTLVAWGATGRPVQRGRTPKR